MNLIGQPLFQLRRLLDTGVVSSRLLAQSCIDRTHDTRALNIYVNFDEQGLLAQADQADQRISAGERLPLLGIPVALKDNIHARGFACSAGTRALNRHPPRDDAGLVIRLRRAGALIAGKVGMHELAFGITNNNAFTGAVRNPRVPDRIPGGSSGGSGAAVAAGVVPVSIGTDTGGSVRVPAALCGVAGFRPTVGHVPAKGVVPISATRDTAGPLALSIADCALVDAVLSADDRELPWCDLSRMRIGVPRRHFWDNLQPEVRSVGEAAMSTLERAGVHLIEIDLPQLASTSQEASFPIALFEFIRDMSTYLATEHPGITLEDVIDAVKSPDVAAICKPLLTSHAVSNSAYHVALQARQRLRTIYDEGFRSKRLDAVMFPTTPRTASLVGEDQIVSLNGENHPVFPTFTRNTDPGSTAGLPGLSLPIGFDGRLPIGLAFDAPIGRDRELLAMGIAIEKLFPTATPITP